jgi:hypothetical protein
VIAAAEGDLPVMKVIKAGQMPPPARFAGDDFAAEPVADAPAPATATEATDATAGSHVIAADVPAEHAPPPGTPVDDALAAILALSEEERLALFS